jgi:hypothetical protein
METTTRRNEMDALIAELKANPYRLGICGTCACEAHATPENEGYSDCCNDRIEYGDEAIETVRREAAARA